MRAALLGLGLWGTASAAEVAVVGVHDAARSVEQQEALVEAVAQGVGVGGRHVVVSGAELASRMAGRQDLVLQETFLAEGRRALDDGRLLYQQAQAADAVIMLEQAVQSLDEAVAFTRTTRELWEAYMLLATARAADGFDAAARDAVTAALAVHPARRPDPASYPPSIINMWEEEAALTGDESAAVVLDAGVQGALLWLDGRAAGESPAAIGGLYAGIHHVHARSTDGRVGYARVDLVSGDERAVRVTLGAPVLGTAARSAGGRTAQAGGLYRALGRYAQADVVVLAGLVDGIVQLQLYHPDTDAFGEPMVLAPQASDETIIAAAVKLVDAVSPDGALPSARKAWTALPLELPANRLLARDLITPIVRVAPTPVTLPPPTDTPGPEAPVARKKWPVAVGVTIGVVLAATGATVAGVLLSDDGVDERAGGTIIIGPPLRDGTGARRAGR